MAEPTDSVVFVQRWGPPHRNRKDPGHHTRASFGKLNLNAPEHTGAASAGARAAQHAVRRAAELKRCGELPTVLGLVDAASRLAAIATEIRAEVLA